jgi:septum formation protein
VPDSSLVLASSSPRRKSLLEQAGFRFTIEPADIDETVGDDESPETATARLAIEKAATVRSRAVSGVVLAADTSVVCGGRMLGKPTDFEHAVAMLRQLSGRNHRVITCWAAVPDGGDPADVITGAAISVVRMRDIRTAELLAYASGPEPYDKAGAYAAQGEGRRFIAAVLGSFDNVIGLPVAQVTAALARLGVRPGSS